MSISYLHNKLNFIDNCVLVNFLFDQFLPSAEYFRAPCFRETTFAHFINVRALSLLLSRPVHLLGFATIALLVLRIKNKQLLEIKNFSCTGSPIGQLHHYLVSVFFFFKYVQPQKADNQFF